MLLHEELQKIRLFHIAQNLDEFLSKAEKESWKPKRIIEQIINLETKERFERSTQQRLKAAKLGKLRLMAHFDWAWPKEIDRPLIEELMHLEFMKEHQNVILAGSQGVGKTMIAKNIALSAIYAGHRVLFTTAADLVLDLAAQETTGQLARRIKRYQTPQLLVIDELGYLNFDTRAADLLFDVVTKRYEAGSIVVTTNLAFKDWGSIFQGATSVAPLIDRLTHKAEITKIVADSYRTKESLLKRKARDQRHGKRTTH